MQSGKSDDSSRRIADVLGLANRVEDSLCGAQRPAGKVNSEARPVPLRKTTIPGSGKMCSHARVDAE